MKRWSLRVCMFVLAGATINVAVAWGFVVCHGSGDQIERSCWVESPDWQSTDEERASPRHLKKLGLSRRVTIRSMTGSAASTTSSLQSRTGITITWIQCESLDVDAVELSAGWPVRSLADFRSQRDELTLPPTSFAVTVGLTFFNSWKSTGEAAPWAAQINGGDDSVWLPSEPLWPGFALNTLFYAAILWVLWFVPRAVRRTLRRRRGLCPACAYPVGGGEVCSECGAPRPRRNAV